MKKLGKAYEAINKRLVESFNHFTPLLQNVSNELQTTNQNLIALGNAVENEGKATRQQLLDGTNALGKQLENGQTQTTKLITDSTGAIVNQLANTQLTRDQLYQDLYQQNMRGIIQNFMDAIQMDSLPWVINLLIIRLTRLTC